MMPAGGHVMVFVNGQVSPLDALPHEGSALKHMGDGQPVIVIRLDRPTAREITDFEAGGFGFRLVPARDALDPVTVLLRTRAGGLFEATCHVGLEPPETRAALRDGLADLLADGQLREMVTVVLVDEHNVIRSLGSFTWSPRFSRARLAGVDLQSVGLAEFTPAAYMERLASQRPVQQLWQYAPVHSKAG